MTHTEPEHRRSRLGWALRTEPTTTPAGTHDHGQRNGPLFLAFFCIVGLFAVNVGLVWFILARGEARDAAEQRMREQIRSGYCELLDAFPADVLLDSVRERFDCGPGIAIEDLPPEVQENLNNRNTAPLLEPAPLPDGAEVVPEGAFPGGAEMQPDEPEPEPYFPTPGEPEPPATVPYPPGFPPPDPVQPATSPDPSPPAEPPPVIDLGPITDPVCQLTSVCL